MDIPGIKTRSSLKRFAVMALALAATAVAASAQTVSIDVRNVTRDAIFSDVVAWTTHAAQGTASQPTQELGDASKGIGLRPFHEHVASLPTTDGHLIETIMLRPGESVSVRVKAASYLSGFGLVMPLAGEPGYAYHAGPAPRQGGSAKLLIHAWEADSSCNS